MKKIGVVLYPNYSLQEITCITSTLSIWFNEEIDYIASENICYFTEEGLPTYPTKLIQEVSITDYDCVIIPGSINPLAGLYDDELIHFLHQGISSDIVFAAISSAPLLLGKAGLLKGKKYTGGLFVQQLDYFDFMEIDNFTHKSIEIEDGLITGIGMYFIDFAKAVLKYLDYPIDGTFLNPSLKYTEKDLLFYYSEEDYLNFVNEVKTFEK
ncbi:DJ-1/PfpI family protein [Enterococcus cecorum]|uniref:DJ-1/PfpI family protein n=1 Tax=Enterococcus cecorum TaxID=44008 RepID=UPI00148B7FEA|nr:DJ-1/PfpI family protein [Enterococcus cecorum]MBM6935827.1 DJ-1/PfpI family protein [Enterococcus cecorum]MCJ0591798.1 DJ-1/PfpI family protein [Enterococcus cecorum]